MERGSCKYPLSGQSVWNLNFLRDSYPTESQTPKAFLMANFDFPFETGSLFLGRHEFEMLRLQRMLAATIDPE